MMSKSDSLSRFGDINLPHGPSELALEYFAEFGEETIQAVLLGRHLIAAGMKPGKHFGPILKKAYDIQIEEGITDPDTLLELSTKESK